MKRIITFSVVAALVLALLSIGSPAQAGTATDVALGLASFAVFNQFVGAIARPAPVYAAPVVVAPAPVIYQPAPPVVYQPAPVVYQPAPVLYQPAPVYAPAPVFVPAPPAFGPYRTVGRYPHGRYELRWHGHHQVWVWVPTAYALPMPRRGY